MFDAIRPQTNQVTSKTAALAALRDYIGEHREALLKAVELLGGGPGRRIAFSVIDDLQGSGLPARRTIRQLGRLLDLLMLKNAYEDTLEAERLVLLDPSDPRVEEICLLADALAALLDEYRAASDTDGSDEGHGARAAA